MATRHNRFNFHIRLFTLLSLIALGQTVVVAQSRPKKTASVKTSLAPLSYPTFLSESAMRQAVYDSAAKFIGRTERTNRNDADWISAINRFNHLPKNAHYCASAFYYVHAVNGVFLPVDGPGMVRSYFSSTKRVVYLRSQRGNKRVGRKIQRMDAVSLYVSHVEGIAQDRYDPDEDETVRLIGFNTSGGKGTKDGCYVNVRRTDQIKVIANWITPYYQAKIKPKNQK